MGKKKHALVTGGAGFIGSHLCAALLDAGYHVTVIDNLSTGSLENCRQYFNDAHFTFIEGSIIDKNVFQEVTLPIDIIFHLAAAVGVKYIIDNPLGSIHTNVMGAENVFEFANTKKIKVVLSSTSEVYGKNDSESLQEEDDRILGSTHITRWSYAASKALDEFIAFAYYRKYGLPIVITRIFNTCGPRQSGQYGMVIPRFIHQALNGLPLTVYGDGEQIRSFTYVSDTVNALMRLGEDENCVGQVFNIGGSDPITIRALARRIKKKTKSASPIVFVPYEEAYGEGFEDMKKRVPNISKIAQYVNYKPQVGIDEILDRTIDYTKECTSDTPERIEA